MEPLFPPLTDLFGGLLLTQKDLDEHGINANQTLTPAEPPEVSGGVLLPIQDAPLPLFAGLEDQLV